MLAVALVMIAAIATLIISAGVINLVVDGISVLRYTLVLVAGMRDNDNVQIVVMAMVVLSQHFTDNLCIPDKQELAWAF